MIVQERLNYAKNEASTAEKEKKEGNQIIVVKNGR